MKKVILKIILGSIILEAILICVFILLGNFNEVTWKSMASVAIVLECSIPCLFYAKIYDNPKYKNIAILSAAISGINAIISILTLLIEFNTDIIGKILSTLQSFMWTLVFVSQLLSYNLTEKTFNYLKRISICNLVLLNIFMLYTIWTKKFPKDFAARLFVMIIVLSISSYIATLIAVEIYRKNTNKNLNSEDEKIQDTTKQLNNDNNAH